MTYVENYQNEQADSIFFKKHLNIITNGKFGLNGKKVVEIGCGKGHFIAGAFISRIKSHNIDPAVN